MPDSLAQLEGARPRLLLLDTCGDPATLALTAGASVLWQSATPGRSASAEILPLLSAGLEQVGWGLAELDGIGVVNGPGSFTGMRVGLAVAKGLCVATGKPLATVSRLAVMIEAARYATQAGTGLEGARTAVLSAGRGELYALRSEVQGRSGQETLLQADALAAFAQGTTVVFAEEGLGAQFGALDAAVQVRIDASASLRLMRPSLAAGGVPVALADAHYVRAPEDTFKRPAARVLEPLAG